MNLGYIQNIIKESNTTWRFVIENPSLKQFDFTAGQLIQLGLKLNDTNEVTWRNYSISSWPDGTNRFEIIVTYRQNGAFSEHLFKKTKIGDIVEYSNPVGAFVLPKHIDRDIMMISTGTGISPFRSMVNWIKQSGVETKNIYLYSGARTKMDLLYYDEFMELQNELPKFKYTPVLSREKWDGAEGYVHRHYIRDAVSEEKPLVYLCGWTDMIWDARFILKDLGFELGKDIKIENFG